MKDVTIFIPTHNRAEQTTWTDIAQTKWRSATSLVIGPAAEKQFDFGNANVVLCPEQGYGPARVRDWMLKHCPTRYLIMLDDDLKFQTRTQEETKSGTLSVRRATAAGVNDALLWLYNRVKDGYAQSALAERSRNFSTRDNEGYDTRAIQAVAFDLDQINGSKLRYLADVPAVMKNWVMMTDFHMTLQILEAGLTNVISYVHRYGAAPSNAPGGCSGMRTVQRQRESAMLLQQNHPRSVTLVEKQNDNWKGELEGQTLTDVRINWAAAKKE